MGMSACRRRERATKKRRDAAEEKEKTNLGQGVE